MTDINHYLGFVLTIFLRVRRLLRVPVATVVLVLFGVMTADRLAAKRPYAVVGARGRRGADPAGRDLADAAGGADVVLFEIGVYIAPG